MRGTCVARTWTYDPTLYAPARFRKACRYEAFVPDPLEGVGFSLPSGVVGILSDAEQAIIRLNALASPALAPLARLLLRTESIASSRVEGLQVGIRSLARAESRMETGGKASPTVLEVIGNIEAMQLAVDDAATAGSVDPGDLMVIHAKLMATAPNAHVAGVLRTVQNWIGGNNFNPCGADFVPPPPEHVPQLLADLCRAVEDNALPPLVQAALVHAQFETIHPFDDGNGRTGRALIHVVLRRRGIARSYVPPVSVVLANDREQYIQGLTRFREGDVEGWIEHFSIASAQAAGLAEAYLGAVTARMGRWRDMLAAKGAPRSDAAAWALINVLPAHPVITAPVAAAATGRAKAAIHQAIGQLEQSGVLVPLSEARRNRSWEAVGLLELLEGLEAGRPPG